MRTLPTDSAEKELRFVPNLAPETESATNSGNNVINAVETALLFTRSHHSR